MSQSQTEYADVVSSRTAPDGKLEIILRGRLDSHSIGTVWKTAVDLVKAHARQDISVDASGLTYCDMSGIALVRDLPRIAKASEGTLKVEGLPDHFKHLSDLFPDSVLTPPTQPPHRHEILAEQLGRATVAVYNDTMELVSFIGELAAALGYALTHPAKARWKETLGVIELSGVNAFPIIVLMGFLFGLILAFQGAVPMMQFGAAIYVSDLVAISLIKELGPIVTAVIFAGRSGSAFAAEIGTMKINDEINALKTMGLDPVRFLAVPRVMAGILVMPILTIFTNLFGLIGAAIVVRSIGYPFVTYVNHVTSAVNAQMLLIGLMKSCVFGLLVAGVGCLRGLQTKEGSEAVGISTTSAVVSSIILIVVTDGLFAVLFYYLGI